MGEMEPQGLWRSLRRSHTGRMVLVAIGCLFLIVTAIIGPLPGPGGIVTFAIGAGLILQNSAWAKRVYARSAKRWPKPAGWCNWALRRPSAKRRARIAAGD